VPSELEGLLLVAVLVDAATAAMLAHVVDLVCCSVVVTLQ